MGEPKIPKDLEPEEKLAWLARLKKKKAEELAAAEREIAQASEQLSAKREHEERARLLASTSNDDEAMSEEERVVAREVRGSEFDEDDFQESAREDVDDSEVVGEELEARIEQSQIPVPSEVVRSDYALHLSREPIHSIYEEMQAVYDAVSERGYITPEEMRFVRYNTAAVGLKQDAADAGEYNLDQLVAIANVTKSLGRVLMQRPYVSPRNDYQSN